MCRFRGRRSTYISSSCTGIQHFVNLELQISRQAQHLVNFEVESSWQAQHFVNLSLDACSGDCALTCALWICLIHTPGHLDLCFLAWFHPGAHSTVGNSLTHSPIHYLDVCSGDCVLRCVLSLISHSHSQRPHSLSFTSILAFTHARIHCHTLTHSHSLTDSLSCCALWRLCSQMCERLAYKPDLTSVFLR